MSSIPAMNPFRPGAGLPPTYMGHRPEIERPLLDMLDRLRHGRRGPHFHYLYGPRGNGKTVLLRWLDERATPQHDIATGMTRIHLLPEDMRTPERLANALAGAQPWLSRSLKRLRMGLKADASGSVSVSMDGQGNHPSPPLGRLLADGTAAVLLTLDEAHEADPQMLGDLLNAVQYAGRTRPIGVVVTGTPGLVDALDASNASFWNRGRHLPVGLLPRGEALAVLAQPLAQAGYTTEECALTALARAADDYPFFLQLYGEAAWNTLQQSDARVLSTGHVEAAIRTIEPRRRQYYRDRYREFRKDGALSLVRDVALAFRDAGGAMTDAQLDAVLDRHDGAPGTKLSLLYGRGFIWQAGDDHWTPGIPSLMDYMTEQTIFRLGDRRRLENLLSKIHDSDGNRRCQRFPGHHFVVSK